MQPLLKTTKENAEIEDIFIGKSKDSLDRIGDHSLATSEVVTVFWHFIKYFVKCCSTPQSKPLVNAFNVMMQAQADLDNVGSSPMLLVKNKLDQLNNNLNAMVRSEGLFWKADEVHGGTAKNTLHALSDALWYVDGSHSTFVERNCEGPQHFSEL